MEYPILETFPLNHPSCKAVERAFGVGRFRRIAYTPKGPLGNCYWTVNDHVAVHGGKAVLGWQVVYWPGLFVEGLHHAVWQSPEGELHDLTEKYRTDTRKSSTFVADPLIEIDLEQPFYIPTKVYQFSNAPAVAHLVKLSKDQLEYKRNLTHRLIAAGGRWDPRNGVMIQEHHEREFARELAGLDLFEHKIVAAFDACGSLSRR